jgi:hypothetical protein
MVYEDDNGKEHARQMIPYTDFPIGEITLCACCAGEQAIDLLAIR